MKYISGSLFKQTQMLESTMFDNHWPQEIRYEVVIKFI